jgi:hypothetical protein
MLEDVGVVTRVEGVAVAQHKGDSNQKVNAAAARSGAIVDIIHYIGIAPKLIGAK